MLERARRAARLRASRERKSVSGPGRASNAFWKGALAGRGRVRNEGIHRASPPGRWCEGLNLGECSRRADYGVGLPEGFRASMPLLEACTRSSSGAGVQDVACEGSAEAGVEACGRPLLPQTAADEACGKGRLERWMWMWMWMCSHLPRATTRLGAATQRPRVGKCSGVHKAVSQGGPGAASPLDRRRSLRSAARRDNGMAASAHVRKSASRAREDWGGFGLHRCPDLAAAARRLPCLRIAPPARISPSQTRPDQCHGRGVHRRGVHPLPCATHGEAGSQGARVPAAPCMLRRV